MALPAFIETGDLPVGIHAATREEIVARFGAAQGSRHRATQDLLHVYSLAVGTGSIQRFIIAHWQNKRDGTRRGIIEVIS